MKCVLNKLFQEPYLHLSFEMTPVNYSRMFFYSQVAKQMVSLQQKKLRCPQDLDNGPVEAGNSHTRVVFKRRPKICLQCKREGKRTAGGRCPSTPFGCLECDIHLHR